MASGCESPPLRGASSWRGTVAPVLLGLVLASLPFLRYRLGDPHPTAHADHRPRYGGTVVMAGDVHLEIVSAQNGITVHASDPWRRPLALRDGRIRAGSGPWRPLAGAGRVEPLDDSLPWTLEVILDDGRRAGVTLPPATGGGDA